MTSDPLLEHEAGAEATKVGLTSSDSALMANFAEGFATEDLSQAQREALQELRGRLKVLAATTADRLSEEWRAFRSVASNWQFSGAVARDLWCCAFPSEVPDKSFGLQVALIVSANGVEVCVCLGAGTTQSKVLATRELYENAMAVARQRLGTMPSEIVNTVQANLGSSWRYRREWRLAPEGQEFDSMGSWLAYASSATGAGASISRYLTASDVDGIDDFVGLLESVAADAQPLFDWVYPSGSAQLDIESTDDAGVPEVQAFPVSIGELSAVTLWSEEDLQEILGVLSGPMPHVILAGPPGTGKTWVARQIAKHLSRGMPGRVLPVQFHPSYSYEEFVEGLRPVLNDGVVSFDVVPGIVRRWSVRASQTTEPVLLLIDEINRANLPKVFGELMLLLEYRSEPIDLQYSEGFALPPNACLLATMNTADRSIRSIDIAMRRRFEVFECRPSSKILSRFYGDGHGTNAVPDLASGLESLNEWLEQQLDRHHTIGHTYLMAKLMDRVRLRQVWDRQLLPLLEDYFFDQKTVLDELDPADHWTSLK